MNEAEAKKLVKQTFSGAYDEKKFLKFISELLGGRDILAKLELVDEVLGLEDDKLKDFRDKITECKRLAKFKDVVGEGIDVFAVKLKDSTILERERSFQRNFIASQLKKFGKDAALVAFYTDNQKRIGWRFSFVHLQYKRPLLGKNEYLVHRSSFLAGDTIRDHTTEQLAELLMMSDAISITALNNAFSVESVTNNFYKEYKKLYETLRTHLQNNKNINLYLKDSKGDQIPPEDFAKHLLGQLVFLYFLQKKGWLGAKKDEHLDEGDPNFLQKLYKKKDYKNFYDDKLTYLLHHVLATERYRDNDYYKLFDCKIPYLNGGLFEPFRGYDWENLSLNIRNDIFENIFNVFNAYNFTVHEDEVLESEVAVDPEMLGKVFENLIPENERKGSGTFYTPRKIVYYMCQESLTDYLYEYFENSIPREDLEKFVIYCDAIQEHDTIMQQKKEAEAEKENFKDKIKLPDSIKKSAPEIDQALQDIRICDPAIGSGTFPVAIMLEITRLRIALDKTIEREEPLTAYQCKRHCIEYCLYGADMDFSAVEIARLRFWLSLTIEKETSDIRQDRIRQDRIVPLPNLEYKIIEYDALKRTKTDEPNEANTDKRKKLKKMLRQFFSERNKQQKEDLKRKINSGIKSLSKGKFDLRFVFIEVFDGDDDDEGFSIILANPPYIQLQNDSGKLGNIYKEYGYGTFVRSGDIYTLFYERAVDLLKKGGRFAFITSNKWMRTNYGKYLRNFFTTQTTPVVLVDLGSNAFETATVDTNILITRKDKPSPDMVFRAAIVHDHNEQDLDLYQYMQDNENIVDMHLPENDEQWLILSEVELDLLEKIEAKGEALKDLGIEVNSGVKTGYNEAFIIDSKIRDKLISDDPKSKEILKPVLRGKDIKKWHPIWKNKWLITTFPSLNIDIDNYPVIKDYLLEEFGESRLEQTGENDARKKTPHKWFESQDPIKYHKEFVKEKTIYPELNQICSFVYDTNNSYLLNSAYMLNSDSVNLKNLTAFLNSNISQFWLSHNCTSLGNRGRRMLAMFLNELPIYEKINDCDELGTITEAITNGEDIQKHEDRLNKILYDLYELTDAEIEILEKTTQSITT